MDKAGKIYRAVIEKEFRQKLANRNSLFVVGYSGLKAHELTELRSNLSQTNAKLFVIKNSLASRVLKEIQLKELIDFLNGPTAFILGYDDPILIAKTVFKFAEEHTALEFQGGILEKRLIDRSDFASLATMSSKDELRAKLVICVKAPLNNLIFALSGIFRKPIYALRAIRDKK